MAGIIPISPGHDGSYPWRQIGTSAAFLAARQAAGRRSARGPRAMLPIDEAVALYLQLLRNANHGFTPERDADERRDRAPCSPHFAPIAGRSEEMSSVAIVWPCPLAVDAYAAASCEVAFPSSELPVVRRPITF